MSTLLHRLGHTDRTFPANPSAWLALTTVCTVTMFLGPRACPWSTTTPGFLCTADCVRATYQEQCCLTLKTQFNTIETEMLKDTYYLLIHLKDCIREMFFFTVDDVG